MNNKNNLSNSKGKNLKIPFEYDCLKETKMNWIFALKIYGSTS